MDKNINSFEICSNVFSLMHSFHKPWFIAGGWAVDLFIDHITREHHDIEIAIFRQDQMELKKYLKDWEFNKIRSGTIEPWETGEWIYLPTHEVYAEMSNVKIEILLNESSNGEWIYRRDNRIKRPLSKIIMHSKHKIPFLCPEIVLLYKSKNPKNKDEHDFNNINGLLDKERKAWLKQALQICNSQHDWINLL